MAIEAVVRPDPSLRFKVNSVAATPLFQNASRLLVDAWLEEAAELPGASVSLALRASAAAIASERADEVIEVVWTGPRTPEVPVRLTSAVLIDVIEAASKELVIISFAAYKVDVVLAALKEAASRGVRISIILETDKVGGGTLSFAARPAFKDLKDTVAFYIWPESRRPLLQSGRAALHAKAAVADDHTALVTSANLTGHAISENMELGLMVKGGPIPRRLSRHFLQLMGNGTLEQQF